MAALMAPLITSLDDNVYVRLSSVDDIDIMITKRLKPAQTQDKKPVSADPKVLKNKLSKSKRSKKQKSAKVTVTGEEVKPDTEIKENQPTEDSRVSNPVQEYRKEKMFPPIIIESPINTPVVKLDIKDDSFKPHGTYLTREKTEFDPVYSKRQKRDTQSRRAYLQLDLLRSGDIFGLDSVARRFQGLPEVPVEEGLEHLHPTMASEPKGVSLVSDGAEVIRISKRFFLLHAKNNTMLRVETMHREYMNPEEARDSLYTAETWNQYKSEIMKRMVSALSSRA
ncbi:unnamed protein product [Mytilus edulis]|uniref:Uncharacterized protein n=1 Tax=Mytilus edulis TaxID=6550 RepID=A0A8S3SSE0_MYTED|nr:unnamed protein product [Mytilus edulis]